MLEQKSHMPDYSCCLHSQSSQRRGAQSCMQCQAGRLCNQTSLSQSLKCPTGHYCPPGSSVAQPCPPVSIVSLRETLFFFIFFMLLSHTSFYQLHLILFDIIHVVKWCYLIFQGSYSDQPGGDSVQHCRPCEAGWYCSRAGLSDPQGLCSPGHYCTSGASTASPVRRGEQWLWLPGFLKWCFCKQLKSEQRDSRYSVHFEKK